MQKSQYLSQDAHHQHSQSHLLNTQDFWSNNIPVSAEKPTRHQEHLLYQHSKPLKPNASQSIQLKPDLRSLQHKTDSKRESVCKPQQESHSSYINMQGNLKSLQDKISDLQKKLAVVEKPTEKLY